MGNKQFKERDFHHGEGHSVPLFIRFVWSALIIWGIIYLIRFGLPDLKNWIAR